MMRSRGSHLVGAEFTTAQPRWARTGYTFFPYAAQQSGHWWVLRLNVGFPEHDMYTVFIDGTAAADLTAGADNPAPLVAGVAGLQPHDGAAVEPALDADTATAVVQAVARYVNYGSEHNDPCLFCSKDYDPMTRV